MRSETKEARTEILRRIAVASGGRHPLATSEVEDARAHLPRAYRTRATMASPDVLALFEHRLLDYGACVETCSHAEIASTLDGMLERRAVRSMAVPSGLPRHWLPARTEFLHADSLGHRELDRCDGVLTGATVAIAETGTLVLQTVAGQGRRAATLVPDYHLCVVRVADVVQTVPEAFRRLEKTNTLPTTFISGPSATADIEMTRIKGVHGPRFLDVLLVS